MSILPLLVFFFEMDQPGLSTSGLLPIEPATSWISEKLTGLSLSDGTRCELRNSNRQIQTVEAEIEIPDGGYAALLVARRSSEEIWIRAGRHPDLASGVVITSSTSPATFTPAADRTELPKTLMIRADITAKEIVYDIFPSRRAHSIGRGDGGRTFVHGSFEIGDDWHSTAGLGAGPTGIVVKSFEVRGRTASGGELTKKTLFGWRGKLFSNLDGSRLVLLAAVFLFMVFWAWQKSGAIVHHLGYSQMTFLTDPRVHLLGGIVLLCLAAWKIWIFLPACLLVITTSPLIRTQGKKLSRRFFRYVHTGQYFVFVAVAIMVIAGGYTPFFSPKTDDTLIDVPGLKAEWRSPSLATVWAMPESDRIHALFDITLQPGQAVLVQWSARNPEPRNFWFPRYGKNRPGLLIDRLDQGISLTALGNGQALRRPLRLPRDAGNEQLQLEVSHVEERVSISLDHQVVLEWKALPPSNPFVRIIPLTVMSKEPHLIPVFSPPRNPPFPAAARLFGSRLLFFWLAALVLTHLCSAPNSLIIRRIVRYCRLLVVTNFLAGLALLSRDSDVAALFANLSALIWSLGGMWILIRWMVSSRKSVLRKALGFVGFVFGIPATLFLAGPTAATFAYPWWRSIPAEIEWAFDPVFEWEGGPSGDFLFRGQGVTPAWVVPEQQRLVTMGGSQTYGISRDDVLGDKSNPLVWPSRLANLYDQIELVNLAMAGKRSVDMVRLATGTYPLIGGKCYLGVFGVNDRPYLREPLPNDFIPETTNRGRWPKAMAEVPNIWPILSLLADFSQYFLPTDFHLENHEDKKYGNLVNLDRFLKKNGVKLVLVYEPDRCQVYGCPGLLSGFRIRPEEDRQRFLDWAAGNGILAIDPISGLREWRQGFLFFDLVHFTIDGHTAMTAVLKDQVRTMCFPSTE